MSIFNFFASVVETIAKIGAGAASTGLLFEPEMPEELS